MEHLDTRKRLLAAEKLLQEDSTTIAKFNSIRKLIKGLDPKLDKTLTSASKALSQIEQIRQKKVIKLVAAALPAKTKQQKKRKKALLLFLKYWKQLKSEVKRVKGLMEKPPSPESNQSVHHATTATKIAAFAKGPLGVVTIAAAAIAAGLIALKSVAVNVVITNDGCNTIHPQTSVNISLPGLSLPSNSIPSGSQATATLPPLKFTVDARGNSVHLSAYNKFNFTFAYSGKVDILFNDSSLIGKSTQIDLGSQKTHSLILRCL